MGRASHLGFVKLVVEEWVRLTVPFWLLPICRRKKDAHRLETPLANVRLDHSQHVNLLLLPKEIQIAARAARPLCPIV